MNYSIFYKLSVLYKFVKDISKEIFTDLICKIKGHKLVNPGAELWTHVCTRCERLIK